MSDPFDLQRFVEAQRLVYGDAMAELRRGTKESHWMWFVFPQLQGLGSSQTAQRYAISSIEEARSYLLDPVLGLRLKACAETVNAVEGRTIAQIFGYPDNLKFHSSMTLFSRADPEIGVFRAALAKYFDGREDEKTIALL